MYRPQLRYPHFKKTVNHILCWQDSQKHPWDLCSQPLKEVFRDLGFIFLVGFGRVFFLPYPIHLHYREVCARALGD